MMTAGLCSFEFLASRGTCFRVGGGGWFRCNYSKTVFLMCSHEQPWCTETLTDYVWLYEQSDNRSERLVVSCDFFVIFSEFSIKSFSNVFFVIDFYFCV